MKKIFTCIILTAMLSGPLPVHAQKLQIDVRKETVKLDSLLYGLFFEDINYGADGGIYAELIQNRSFEYFPVYGKQNDEGYKLHPMYAWGVLKSSDSAGQVYVTRSQPLNENNRNHIEIICLDGKSPIGIYNSGYDGIPLNQEERYDFSLYYRFENLDRPNSGGGEITVSLEDEDGEILDSVSFSVNARNDYPWAKFEYIFTPSESVDDGRLSISVSGSGKYDFDMISLMPQSTYKNHKNGLRRDLIEALEELEPKFLRFPGGCIMHGWGLDNIYDWKETVGDVAFRKSNWNRWGYHQTYGLGYYEYFLLCEDLGAEPLPVLPVGVTCGFCGLEAVPMDKLDSCIQDMLDLVEFANGDPSSGWGRIRAEMGHPAPFDLKFICLGNEEHNTSEFKERFPRFAAALHAAYPDIKIIGTSGLSERAPLYEFMSEFDIWGSDEHYYNRPEWYVENQGRFDDWPRDAPHIFIGEYASEGNTMYNAVCEAVYLTGVERNGDVVKMASYAPLFARFGHTQWKAANLIYFDNKSVVRTPNFFVQEMFSCNKGDVYVANQKSDWPGKELAVSTTVDKARNELIIKFANASDQPREVEVSVAGIGSGSRHASQIILSGDRDAVNTREEPENIKPETSDLKVKDDFDILVDAFSVHFIRIPL